MYHFSFSLTYQGGNLNQIADYAKTFDIKHKRLFLVYILLLCRKPQRNRYKLSIHLCLMLFIFIPPPCSTPIIKKAYLANIFAIMSTVLLCLNYLRSKQIPKYNLMIK